MYIFDVDVYLYVNLNHHSTARTIAALSLSLTQALNYTLKLALDVQEFLEPAYLCFHIFGRRPYGHNYCSSELDDSASGRCRVQGHRTRFQKKVRLQER